MKSKKKEKSIAGIIALEFRSESDLIRVCEIIDRQHGSEYYDIAPGDFLIVGTQFAQYIKQQFRNLLTGKETEVCWPDHLTRKEREYFYADAFRNYRERKRHR